MNKPACTILYKKNFTFFIWPARMTEKIQKQYADTGVNIFVRDIPPVSPKQHLPNSTIVLEHTKRSTDLGNMILDTIDDFIRKNKAENKPLYIATEGLSYGSKGDAVLNLATYKGVMLSKLYEHYQDKLKGLYTYPPIAIKATAGCARKEDTQDKNKMINAFMRESVNLPIKDILINGGLKATKNYIQCVDDIVDSYFAVKTMLVKEGFTKVH